MDAGEENLHQLRTKKVNIKSDYSYIDGDLAQLRGIYF